MRDPRALRNLKNLESYRAWEQEGYRRSGFGAIGMIVPLLVVVFAVSLSTLPHLARLDVRASLLVVEAAFVLYLAIVLGLGLFAVLRLNAWMRAHPWEPPPPRSPRGAGPLQPG